MVGQSGLYLNCLRVDSSKKNLLVGFPEIKYPQRSITSPVDELEITAGSGLSRYLGFQIFYRMTNGLDVFGLLVRN